MSKEYLDYVHTHCFVAHPKAQTDDDKWVDEAWEGYQYILLHTTNRVWVAQSYCGEGHPDVKLVNDGTGEKGYDSHGCCILSVPAEWCTYATQEDAEAYAMAKAAEEDAYGYWHGTNR